MPHARELIQLANHPRELELLSWVARYDYDRGDYRSATTLSQRQLDARRRVQGEEHPDTLSSLGDLAATLRDQGDLAGARKVEEQVLDAR